MLVTSKEQSERLLSVGISTKTADFHDDYPAWTLPALWDYFHGMDKTYEFDTSMSAEELMETLVRIIVFRNKQYIKREDI